MAVLFAKATTLSFYKFFIDALIAPIDVRYDYVLANSPFAKKSSQAFTNEEGEQKKEDPTYKRQDLKDKSPADLYNLPDPYVLAEEKAENLESALGELQGGDQAVEAVKVTN